MTGHREMQPARMRSPVAWPRRARRFGKRIAGDQSGVSLIEFGLILPVFVTLGMLGSEVAYMASVNMEVSQIALSLADNASRLGQTDNSSFSPTISESNIDSVMTGALEQGSRIDLGNRGRIILSSLERDPDTGQQYIHWQRCQGDLDRQSSYGDDGENNGLGATTITGVGNANSITAAAGSAVMVAEIYYSYDGLFGDVFTDGLTFRQEAVYVVRDDRDLNPAGDPDGVTGTGGNSQC